MNLILLEILLAKIKIMLKLTSRINCQTIQHTMKLNRCLRAGGKNEKEVFSILIAAAAQH